MSERIYERERERERKRERGKEPVVCVHDGGVFV